MKRLEFNIEINATPEKVWQILWNDTTYREWTTIFCEGSYAVSNWNEGDSIHFLTPSGEGMFSIIDKRIENKFMAFKHFGEIKDFKEMPIDEATQEWIGAMEIYELTANGSTTVLNVKMDIIEKYEDYFNTTLPNALEKIKQLSE